MLLGRAEWTGLVDASIGRPMLASTVQACRQGGMQGHARGPLRKHCFKRQRPGRGLRGFIPTLRPVALFRPALQLGRLPADYKLMFCKEQISKGESLCASFPL